MNTSASSFGRGVWLAPWRGPNGETILVAVDSEKRIIGDVVTVPIGGNDRAATDELWDLVDRSDRGERQSAAPRLTLVRGGVR